MSTVSSAAQRDAPKGSALSENKRRLLRALPKLLIMKVFLLEPSCRNNDYAYESLWPRAADSAALRRFNCVPKGENWDEQGLLSFPLVAGAGR